MPRRRIPATVVALLVLGGSVLAGRAQASGEPMDRIPVRAAEEWIAENLNGTERLVVDPEVAEDLAHSGWAVGALSPDEGPPAPWSTYDYVVATPRMRADPSALAGRALGSSSLLMSFGAGRARTDVLRVDPAGVLTARQADATARRASADAGRQLQRSRHVSFEPTAAQALLRGDVDPNVLGLLVALGSQHEVTVSAFGGGGGTGTDLVRRFTISALDGAPVANGPQAMAVAAWFAAQHPPFLASTVGVTADGLLVVLPLAKARMTGST